MDHARCRDQFRQDDHFLVLRVVGGEKIILPRRSSRIIGRSRLFLRRFCNNHPSSLFLNAVFSAGGALQFLEVSERNNPVRAVDCSALTWGFFPDPPTAVRPIGTICEPTALNLPRILDFLEGRCSLYHLGSLHPQERPKSPMYTIRTTTCNDLACKILEKKTSTARAQNHGVK